MPARTAAERGPARRHRPHVQPRDQRATMARLLAAAGACRRQAACI